MEHYYINVIICSQLYKNKKYMERSLYGKLSVISLQAV